MIFVMPGSSQVGQITIAHLLKMGVPADRVIAGSRRPDVHGHHDVTVRKADYNDVKEMEVALAEVDTLILIPTKTPPALRCVEHANALDAARAAGVKRVIFLSILAAVSTSVSAVAPFILFAENATRNSGLEWAILRMGLFMEPVAEWVPDLLKIGRLPYPVRHGSAAYVTREDVARSLAAVALDPERTNKVYNIAAPKPVTMPELANAISEGCGQHIPFEACSASEFLKICFDGNETPFIANTLISLYKAIENGEFDVSTNDVERLTGMPATGVHEFFSILPKSHD